MTSAMRNTRTTALMSELRGAGIGPRRTQTHHQRSTDARRVMMLLVSGVLAASLLAGCDDDDNSSTGPGGGADTTGGGGGGGGADTTGGAAPTTAAVTLGDIFFRSGRNGSSNPAVDTVAVNGAVTWTWGTVTQPHSVQSLGSPSFTSSAVKTGSGNTHQVTFTAPGTYRYDCAVHGTLMTGTIVVRAAATTSLARPTSP